MYTEVADRLVVTDAADGLTQAVGMAGGNAVLVDIVGIRVDVEAEVTVEASNDLQNWTPIGGTLQITGVSYHMEKVTGIAAAYVRLRFSVPDSGACIFSAGINVANL